MKCLSRQKIDSRKWDQCVLNAANLNSFGLSWYLDIVSPGWSGFVWGDYEAVMPLPFKQKYGFRWLCTPVFTRDMGVYSPTGADTTKTVEALEACKVLFDRIDYNLPCPVENYTTLSRNYQVLQIDEIERMREQYAKNHKRSLKKSHDIRRLSSGNAQELVEFFYRHAGKKIDSLKSKDYPVLKILIKETEWKDTGLILGDYQEDELVAFAAIVYTDRHGHYLKGAVNQSGRKNGSMVALIDHAFEHHLQGREFFDLGGSDVESIANFFKKFGAHDRQYYLFTYRKPGVINGFFNWYLGG